MGWEPMQESFRGLQSIPRCGFTHSRVGRACRARNHVWCLHFSGIQGPIKRPERPWQSVSKRSGRSLSHYCASPVSPK